SGFFATAPFSHNTMCSDCIEGWCALPRRFAASPERFAVLPHRDTNSTWNGCWERSTDLDIKSKTYHIYTIVWPVSLSKQSLCQKVCRDCQKDLPRGARDRDFSHPHMTKGCLR